MSIRILQGDCREVLVTLPDASVQCCVTSPPYYGLRDYGVAGQIGLEQTPAEYVEQMVAVFREVKRVLRNDGVCFLNLGDSYAANRAYQVTDNKHIDVGNNGASRVPDGLKPKDLLGIPWRVAFALQADGWWLRSDIIWAKPNPMPESVTDRPTSAHEHVFLLAKRERYFFDAEAVREPCESGPSDIRKMVESLPRIGGKHKDLVDPLARASSTTNMGQKRSVGDPSGRNVRNVWTIATAPYAEAHFATFPPELAERCIKAGTSERGCCANCGAPWVRQVERSKGLSDREARGKALTSPRHDGNTWNENDGRGFLPVETTTTGWQPSCACNAAVTPCTVLDPFGGAGTTALVADRLGRNAILIELNQQYCDLARNRLTKDAGLFAEVAA